MPKSYSKEHNRNPVSPFLHGCQKITKSALFGFKKIPLILTRQFSLLLEKQWAIGLLQPMFP